MSTEYNVDRLLSVPVQKKDNSHQAKPRITSFLSMSKRVT